MLIGDRFYWYRVGADWQQEAGYDRDTVDRPYDGGPDVVAIFRPTSWPLANGDDGLRGSPKAVADFRAWRDRPES